MNKRKKVLKTDMCQYFHESTFESTKIASPDISNCVSLLYLYTLICIMGP